MKIWIDGNEANLENRVGVNQYAASLIGSLEKLPESTCHDFEICLQSPPLEHLPKERPGWRYKVFPGRGLWIITTLLPRLLLTTKKPDVLFTPSHYSPPFSPVPTVISIMDLSYLTHREQFRFKDFVQLKYWTEWSVRLAKKVIAISQSTKKEIEEYYPAAFGKVEVTLLGYDREKFKRRISKIKIGEVKTKYGIDGDYTLYLGTLKPSKNVEGLVRAFSKLQSLPLALVIAGKKGWLYERIFKLVEENKLTDKVIFTDFVSEKDKPALVAGAQVFVSPSFWEGFGIHILEAMALGTPVVCSRAGSLSEVGGQAVVYVDPGDPVSIAGGIRMALKNQVELSKRGLAQAKKFSWEKTARETLKILESATS